MNYRHGYHAGNFADLVKHAVLLAWVKRLRDLSEPVQYIDTHAGAGIYDIRDERFTRSKEAEAGIGRLMSEAVPESLSVLAHYVSAFNQASGITETIGLYPGSPRLICDHMRATDSYLGCELRRDDIGLLYEAVPRRARILGSDGYDSARLALQETGTKFLLVDPPFDQFTDYDDIVTLVDQMARQKPEARALIWVPLKDLETFDRLLRRLEDSGAPDVMSIEVAQLRLRALSNPMKMNGCALILIGADDTIKQTAASVMTDAAILFGDEDATSRYFVLT